MPQRMMRQMKCSMRQKRLNHADQNPPVIGRRSRISGNQQMSEAAVMREYQLHKAISR